MTEQYLLQVDSTFLLRLRSRGVAHSLFRLHRKGQAGKYRYEKY